MAEPYPIWTEHRRKPPAPGFPYYVPGRLWRADAFIAERRSLLPWNLRSVEHPKFKAVDFSVPAERASAYTALLMHATPDQLYFYLDGNSLAEVFDEMILARDVRAAWQPVVDAWIKIKKEPHHGPCNSPTRN